MPIIADFKALADDKRFIQDSKDIIVQDLFTQDNESFFTFIPGIKGGQQVAALRGFEYVTKASAGCGGNGINPLIPAFSQLWNPKLAEVKIALCYTDFEASFFKWGLKNGYARKDLTGTEMAIFIQDLVVVAMKRDLQRMILFSDANIAAQNVLSDVNKVPFYNIIDKGLIPTLQFLKTLPEFAGNFTTISQNTGNQAAQNALSTTTAVDIYEALIDDNYDFAPDLLLSSQRLYRNYAKWVKRGVAPLQSNVDATVNGLQGLTVDGMPIANIVNYDIWRKSDFVTGVGAAATTLLPHFAMNCKKEDLQVGIDDTASLENINLEYIGGKEETFWIKANYLFDFKMVNPYAFRAAL